MPPHPLEPHTVAAMQTAVLKADRLGCKPPFFCGSARGSVRTGMGRHDTAIHHHICRGNAPSDRWLANGGYERIAAEVFPRLQLHTGTDAAFFMDSVSAASESHILSLSNHMCP